MMEDSPYEFFEPFDLPHVSTHGDEEPVSSSVPASVTHNFSQFTKVYSREKVIPEQKQVQESNSDLGNEITVRSDPPLHTQLGETSTDSTDNLDLDLPIAVRKGTRECTNRPLYPLSHYVSLKHLSSAHKNFIVSLNTIIIPNTVSEALTKREWKDAMREEMSALEKNKTWEIVERPKGKNIVDCKWIFTLKYKADGSLERHKARLIAKGYTQTYGVDYQETFAPVAKMNTIRILLSLAAHYNWQLLQYDLDEEIYMNIPLGFEENTGNKVCKLKKALYGLKQSPRAWFGRFAKVMKESGYKQSQSDHTLFIKHSATGGVTALLVYVDDIIVTGNDEREKHEVKQRLATEFEIKELGKLKYFLGKIGCKPVYTPMDPNHKLGEAKEEPMVDKRMSQRLVGATLLERQPWERNFVQKNNTLALEAYTDMQWDGSMKLYCDNKLAINIAHNPIQHDRTKHIEIDRHFIKEKLEEGVVCMSYVPSEHQLADILTKGLNSSMFHDLVFKLGMEDIYSLA
ncbi:Retrovirus-related Pol polyprotein from transposon RE1 [Vitis vinifera]|uniref:Retrovirus-related Pol polyprotein from transposon RE1 n=1 Tax=Vitis vinifera TaxID=29760 RepID=A0A438IPY9_VITVI|nr:Retrovirus-related Pol polyprotein from transposon RE1 [Vitis vinifera]